VVDFRTLGLQRLHQETGSCVRNVLTKIQQKFEDRYNAIAGLLSYPYIEAARKKNPITAKGESYFSQNDEDGITLEIIRRLGLERSVFVELGVGNGLENNTIILLASGWTGVWIGGEQLAFEIPPSKSRLSFNRAWIDRDNVSRLISDEITKINCAVRDVEFLSIDLDGNDAHLLAPLLASGLRPSIIVCEYNGKFPPPIRFCVEYNAKHEWDLSDYHGASLQVFVDILAEHGYVLVCCNANGINAFFVRQDHADLFADVPKDATGNFIAAKYLARSRTGHRASPKTIRALL
jgi:hypothetical protein